MSTMAVDPLKIDADSWTITKVSEEKIEPAALAEIGAKEADLKKQQDAHVPTTLDAKDALDIAKDDFTSARTAAAKAAAKAKVDAAQTKYDEEYANHQDIIRQYNEAKAAAAKEEEITTFSLGAGQLPNIRDLKGNVHSKEVEIQVKTKAGAVKNYKITIKMYDLKDEAANVDPPRPVGHHEDSNRSDDGTDLSSSGASPRRARRPRGAEGCGRGLAPIFFLRPFPRRIEKSPPVRL